MECEKKIRTKVLMTPGDSDLVRRCLKLFQDSRLNCSDATFLFIERTAILEFIFMDGNYSLEVERFASVVHQIKYQL